MYDLTGFLAVLSNTFNPCIKWSLKKKRKYWKLLYREYFKNLIGSDHYSDLILNESLI